MHRVKEPNPLNFYRLRKFKVPPEHFEFISVKLSYNLEQALETWIKDHLKGRYYIGKSGGLDGDGNFCKNLKIGFEDPKEMSYFVLACPHLKYK